jgi:hypothetical protein
MPRPRPALDELFGGQLTEVLFAVFREVAEPGRLCHPFGALLVGQCRELQPSVQFRLCDVHRDGQTRYPRFSFLPLR